MREIKAKKLTAESFKEYGCFFDFLKDRPENHQGEVFFKPDLLQVRTNNDVTSFSYAYSYPRQALIKEMEAHLNTEECVMAVNGESVFFVCSSNDDGTPNVDAIEAFYIPKGVALSIKPRIWHLAAYPTEDKTLLLVCALPEKTYINDCKKYKISDVTKQILIDY